MKTRGRHIRNKRAEILAALVFFSCMTAMTVFIVMCLASNSTAHIVLSGLAAALLFAAETRMRTRGTQSPRKRYKIVVRNSSNKYKRYERENEV